MNKTFVNTAFVDEIVDITYPLIEGLKREVFREHFGPNLAYEIIAAATERNARSRFDPRYDFKDPDNSLELELLVKAGLLGSKKFEPHLQPHKEKRKIYSYPLRTKGYHLYQKHANYSSSASSSGE